ncbi:unnamed protein product [Pylaiella littoralis]
MTNGGEGPDTQLTGNGFVIAVGSFVRERWTKNESVGWRTRAAAAGSIKQGGGGGSEGVSEEGTAKKEKFGSTGQVLAGVLVAAVAGSIVGARRFRKTMTDTVSRNAQRRKAETEQAARAARGAKGRGAKGGGGGGGWSDAGGVYQDGNPLRGRIPKGWEFDDSKEAAFKEQRLNSQVVQHLSNLGVKNFAADSKEVNAAYRGKAMNLHPDRNYTKENEREFKRVATSYAWLDEKYFRKR